MATTNSGKVNTAHSFGSASLPGLMTESRRLLALESGHALTGSWHTTIPRSPLDSRTPTDVENRSRVSGSPGQTIPLKERGQAPLLFPPLPRPPRTQQVPSFMADFQQDHITAVGGSVTSTLTCPLAASAAGRLVVNVCPSQR